MKTYYHLDDTGRKDWSPVWQSIQTSWCSGTQRNSLGVSATITSAFGSSKQFFLIFNNCVYVASVSDFNTSSRDIEFNFMHKDSRTLYCSNLLQWRELICCLLKAVLLREITSVCTKTFYHTKEFFLNFSLYGFLVTVSWIPQLNISVLLLLSSCCHCLFLTMYIYHGHRSLDPSVLLLISVSCCHYHVFTMYFIFQLFLALVNMQNSVLLILFHVKRKGGKQYLSSRPWLLFLMTAGQLHHSRTSHHTYVLYLCCT